MSIQKGFTLVEGLLIILILSVVGFAGYYVWNNSKDTATVENSTQEIADEHSGANPETKKSGNQQVTEIFINEVEINNLVSVSDLERLPEYTPASFVSFMSSVLEKNVGSEQPCSQNSYSISTISPYNITGGVSPIESGAESCSGAPRIWILNPDGSWEEETRNGTLCESSSGGLVYEEFAEECQLGDEWIPNPNGSIFDIDS